MRKLNGQSRAFRALLGDRILMLDEAMGTMLQERHLTPADEAAEALGGCNGNLIRLRGIQRR
jgi:methionine synthase I (cobalamin-dependent)